MIRIAIVDDHQIVIDGLKLLLNKCKEFQITTEATKGRLMLLQLQENKVDVLLADMMMPEMDGYELAKHVRNQFPEIKIIALSMNSDGAYIDKLIEENLINGYVLKTADKDELIQAIKYTADGDDYFSDEILFELKTYQKLKLKNQDVNITLREKEVIKCMLNGMSNKQIAETLFISTYTVESHRKNIFRKTNTHTVIALAEYAQKHKLFG